MKIGMALGMGTFSFCLAFAVHLLVWRFFQPKKQILLLVVIFLLAPIVLYLCLFSTLLMTEDEGVPGYGIFNFLIFPLVWHGALSLAYIMTYPPIQTGCPSLNIVLAARRSMPAGLSGEELQALFSERSLFSDRVKELGGDGLIQLQDAAWGLTLTGKIVTSIFRTYRRVLGLPFGEG